MKDRIRQLRKCLKLTQQEFANKINSERANIAQYERGRYIPGKMVIASICREFGVNEEWLRTGVGEMFISSDRKDELKRFFDETMADEPDSFRSALVSALAVLDQSHWEVLADIADLIVSKQAQGLEIKNNEKSFNQDQLNNLPTSDEMEQIYKKDIKKDA